MSEDRKKWEDDGVDWLSVGIKNGWLDGHRFCLIASNAFGPQRFDAATVGTAEKFAGAQTRPAPIAAAPEQRQARSKGQ